MAGLMEQFLSKYGSRTPPPTTKVPTIPPSAPIPQSVQSVPTATAKQPPKSDIETLINKYAGSDEYKFYNGTEKLRFDSKLHCYYRVDGDAVSLIPGVTSVCGIIDKSGPLTQWAANECSNYVKVKWAELPEEVRNAYATNVVSMEGWLFETLEAARFGYRAVSKTATDIGHIAHDWLEGWVRANMAHTTYDVQLPEHEQARNCVQAALKWIESHKVRFVETERKIYSRTFEFAGTLDGLAFVSSCDDPNCPACKGEKFDDVLAIIDWKSSRHLYDEYRFQTAAYVLAYKEEFNVEIHDRWILRLGKDTGEFEPWRIAGPTEYAIDADAFMNALSLYNTVKLLEERKKKAKAEAKAAVKAEKEAAKAAEKEAKAAAKAQAKADKDAEKERIKAEKAAAKMTAAKAVGSTTTVEA